MHPTILAIETSSNIGAITLSQNGVMHTDVVRDTVKLSGWLLPAIERLLKQAGVSRRELNAIAFGNGPGAFTGVRTACAAAQGLAYGLRIPLYEVGSLNALAMSTLDVKPKFFVGKRSFFVILDARMNEIFTQEFIILDAFCCKAVSPPRVVSTAELELKATDLMVGSGAVLLAAKLGVASDHMESIRAATEAAEARWSEAIAQIALSRMESGEAGIDPTTASPEYVRNNVAQTEAERAAQRNAAIA